MTKKMLVALKLLKKASYQFVKPLQTAFRSTGLVKKNSVNHNLNDASQRKLPPETPIKKHPMATLDMYLYHYS